MEDTYTSPDEVFKFKVGHKALLMNLGKVCGEKGSEFFETLVEKLKKKRIRRSRSQSQTNDNSSSTNESSETSESNTPNPPSTINPPNTPNPVASPTLEQLQQKLQNSMGEGYTVETFYQNGSQKVSGRVLCTICKKKLSVASKYDRRNTFIQWVTSNFVRHVSSCRQKRQPDTSESHDLDDPVTRSQSENNLSGIPNDI